MASTPDTTPRPTLVQQRTQALVRLFEEVARTRMRGVPILNPALKVQAVGFVQVEDQVQGVLITPWFMNLVHFPLHRLDARAAAGTSSAIAFGNRSFDFIAGHEEAFGSYASCSLFSPMADFASQQAAVATAQAALDHLRAPAEAVATPAPQVAKASAAPQTRAAPAPANEMPARRAFFLARRSGPAGPAAA